MANAAKKSVEARDLKKSELVEAFETMKDYAGVLKNHVGELEEYIHELEDTLVYVRDRKVVEVVEVKKPGRKDEVLAILKRGKPVSVAQLAKEIGINERNISSQLTYLRKDGHRIATDSRGLKFLEK